MDLEYLTGLWQQDDGGARFSVPVENFHESLRRSAKHFERRLHLRDWMELVACFLAGVSFFYTAFIVKPAELGTHWIAHWDWILFGISCWGVGAVSFARRSLRAAGSVQNAPAGRGHSSCSPGRPATSCVWQFFDGPLTLSV